MAEASDDEMERLASRLALLVSDTGEADNAGRAVGALARRLGLSGGDLKQMFLAGSVNAGRGARQGFRGDDAASLQREISALRHSLVRAEVAARAAEQSRDALAAELLALQTTLDRRVRRVRRRVLGSAIAAIGVATAAIVYTEREPRRPVQLEADAAADLAVPRPARVRPAGTTLFAAPERGSPAMGRLPSGTKIVVRRLFWRTLMQWAEVDAPDGHGFVVTTEIDIS